MAEHGEMIQSSDFKDRKTGLVVFGILQIILGGACALMVPFMIIGMLASTVLKDSPAPPISTRTMIPALLLYTLAAAWFICMGIGSIKARRWARALVLVTSWLWLISGTVGLIFVLLLMPDMYDKMAESGQMPPGAAIFMKYVKYVMAAFMTVVYVIIPAVLLLFYGSKNVKATCEFRDPRIRWTDKCPLPVLALSLIFGFWALSMLSTGGYGWTIPFFGTILTGLPGAAVVLVVTFLLGYIAWGLYKLRIQAWWCAVLLIILWALSTAITFSQVSMLDFYEKMNFPEQQLEIMKQYDMLKGSTMALFVGLWVVGLLVYLRYTKKYFPPPATQQNAL